MSSLAGTLLAFIVAIAVLVTVHEYGHFLAARRTGVKVLRFSIGFGRALWRRQGADGTEWVVGALPLGGYVRMLDEREGEVAPDERERAFNRKPLLARSIIVAAGPLANLVFAVVAYWFVFVLGDVGIAARLGPVPAGTPAALAGFVEGERLIAIDGEDTPTWGAVAGALTARAFEDGSTVPVRVERSDGTQGERTLDVTSLVGSPSRDVMRALGFEPWQPELPSVIGAVEPGSPAERAGLRPGDHVLSADGEAIERWSQWVAWVRARPGQVIAVEVARGEVEVALTVTPAVMPEVDGGTIGRIGATVEVPEDLAAAERVEVRYGPVRALGEAVGHTADITMLTIGAMAGMVRGSVSVDQLSGPIGIARYAGESARIGLVPFLKYLAVVSVSLAVLNLLPVPILDGGHLLYFAIEAIRGRPLSESAQAFGQRVGMALLAALIVVAVWQDLRRLVE